MNQRKDYFRMKINEFKRVSNALARTIHAFTLCFENIEVNEASVSFDMNTYNLKFECFIHDLGVGNFSIFSSNNEATLVILSFYKNLISVIDINLKHLLKEDKETEKEWKKHRVFRQEDSSLSSIASLEMLKMTLVGLKDSLSES
jgi:hypothetical protein